MLRSGKLNPARLVGKTITLEDALDELVNMDNLMGWACR